MKTSARRKVALLVALVLMLGSIPFVRTPFSAAAATNFEVAIIVHGNQVAVINVTSTTPAGITLGEVYFPVLTPGVGFDARYRFIEWNTMPDGSGDVITADTVVDRNFSMYAILERIPTVYFQVPFVVKGMTFYTMNIPAGTILGDFYFPVLIPGEQFDDRYDFVEWNTMPDGSGDVITRATVVDRSFTMYAIFERIPTVYFQVPFVVGGATFYTMNIPAGTILGNFYFPVIAPEHLPYGYDFVEWNTMPDGSGDVITPATVVDRSFTMYAILRAHEAAPPSNLHFSMPYVGHVGARSLRWIHDLSPASATIIYSRFVWYFIDLANEGTPGYWTLTAGELPPNFVIDNTPFLDNTPYRSRLTNQGQSTAVGVYNFTLTSTNAAGAYSRDFTIEIIYSPPVTHMELELNYYAPFYPRPVFRAGTPNTAANATIALFMPNLFQENGDYGAGHFIDEGFYIEMSLIEGVGDTHNHLFQFGTDPNHAQLGDQLLLVGNTPLTAGTFTVRVHMRFTEQRHDGTTLTLEAELPWSFTVEPPPYYLVPHNLRFELPSPEAVGERALGWVHAYTDTAVTFIYRRTFYNWYHIELMHYGIVDRWEVTAGALPPGFEIVHQPWGITQILNEHRDTAVGQFEFTLTAFGPYAEAAQDFIIELIYSPPVTRMILELNPYFPAYPRPNFYANTPETAPGADIATFFPFKLQANGRFGASHYNADGLYVSLFLATGAGDTHNHLFSTNAQHVLIVGNTPLAAGTYNVRVGMRWTERRNDGTILTLEAELPWSFVVEPALVTQPPAGPPTQPTPDPSPEPSPDPAPPVVAPPTPDPVPDPTPDPIDEIAVGDVQVSIEVEDNEITVTLTPDDIDEIINHVLDAIYEATVGETPDNIVSLDFTNEAFDEVTAVTLPAELFEAVGDTDLVLEVALPQGTLSFDPGALTSAAQQAGGEPITLSLEQVHIPDIPLGQGRYVRMQDYIFSITASAGDNIISNFDGTINVTVPFSGRLPATVFFLDAEGFLHPRPATNCEETGTVTFTTTHFSLFVIQEADEEWLNPFMDVHAHARYFAAVRFVNQRGLFNGTASHLFSPHESMTRAMMTTILWRMAGEPDVASQPNPFTDVATGRFYTTPIIWAASEGIVPGVGQNRFQPYGVVTLRQAITMLNRYAGRFGLAPFAAPGQYTQAATRAEVAMLIYELE